MANITIKVDPRFGAAIAEGAATVELRAVKAEYAKLQARDAVRSEAVFGIPCEFATPLGYCQLTACAKVRPEVKRNG